MKGKERKAKQNDRCKKETMKERKKELNKKSIQKIKVKYIAASG